MVKRKIVAQTQNDDWTPKKVRKKRKPMTPEQRLAAAERLEKARAAKAPAKKQSIHVARPKLLQQRIGLAQLLCHGAGRAIPAHLKPQLGVDLLKTFSSIQRPQGGPIAK